MKKHDTKHNSHSAEPTNEEIAILAYAFFESEGRLDGHDLEHWRCAEEQLCLAPKLAAQGQAAKRHESSRRANQ